MDLTKSKKSLKAKGKKKETKLSEKPEVSAKKSKSFLSKKSKRAVPVIEDPQDEEIRADSSDELEEKVQTQTSEPAVVLVPAFEGGYVHPSLQNAVAMIWQPQEEMQLFSLAVDEQIRQGHVFVGAISMRTSFITKKGGDMLL